MSRRYAQIHASRYGKAARQVKWKGHIGIFRSSLGIGQSGHCIVPYRINRNEQALCIVQHSLV